MAELEDKTEHELLVKGFGLDGKPIVPASGISSSNKDGVIKVCISLPATASRTDAQNAIIIAKRRILFLLER